MLNRRLSQKLGDRPSITGQDPIAEINAVLAQREPVYLDLADLVCDVSAGDPDETVNDIAARITDSAGA